ncbi:hypothetical protein BKA62DRAFT_729346 [Auriculariales sp. MPI-PUGE-AT-0066]|nr:hypothetical protein BKA62DRAFT_729346 [Auriculariales sp. MPI-PUGE-AT-0066]
MPELAPRARQIAEACIAVLKEDMKTANKLRADACKAVRDTEAALTQANQALDLAREAHARAKQGVKYGEVYVRASQRALVNNNVDGLTFRVDVVDRAHDLLVFESLPSWVKSIPVCNFEPARDIERSFLDPGVVNIWYQSISSMPIYCHWSFEEIRARDYISKPSEPTPFDKILNKNDSVQESVKNSSFSHSYSTPPERSSVGPEWSDESSVESSSDSEAMLLQDVVFVEPGPKFSSTSPKFQRCAISGSAGRGGNQSEAFDRAVSGFGKSEAQKVLMRPGYCWRFSTMTANIGSFATKACTISLFYKKSH